MKSQEIQETVVTVRESGGRLDASLAGGLPDRSRTHVQELIRSGLIEVNGKIIRKPAHEVYIGDSIRVLAAEPVAESERIPLPPLDVVFENDDLLVVNKAPGVVVHPSPGHPESTLSQAVLKRVPQLEGTGEPGREGLVHRLDRDTSGLIVFAKHRSSLEYLQTQFKSRAVQKTYLALADGKPPTDKGRVEASVGRDPRERKRFKVLPSSKGKNAVTEYSVRERFARHTLLEAYPVTGRTHQIRLHLQFLGCPIVGDTDYGRKPPSLDVVRQQLHAWRLSLLLPGEPARSEFEARVPDDMVAALELAKAG